MSPGAGVTIVKVNGTFLFAVPIFVEGDFWQIRSIGTLGYGPGVILGTYLCLLAKENFL